MCSYFSSKSVLSDKNSARCVLALAIRSKFDGLVTDPKVPPKGMKRNFAIMNEKAVAISGWYLQCLKAPLTSLSKSNISECGWNILEF